MTKRRSTVRKLTKLVLGLLMLGICVQFAVATTLDAIKSRGTLIVGVKKDVPLWGLLDPASGEIKGLEPDLAQTLADQLGVKLKLVGLLTSERTDAVVGGKVDVLIATLSDTPERRQIMTLVQPHYYASGVNLLARKSEHFRDWGALRNRRVCGRRGAFYNRLVTVTYGTDVIALFGNDLSFAALRDGRCSALLHDDIAIVSLLQNPDWARDFEMPLTSLYHVPWSIALSPSERGGQLEKIISRLLVGWHRDGVLTKLEGKWGIPSTSYLKEKQTVWQRKENGKWFCGDELTDRSPLECR
jgi:polar amino acid transport system substrate-binding protein